MSNTLITNAIYLDDVNKETWIKNYIGLGYRSVCYNIDNNRNGQIILFGFDKNGNRQTYILPWQSHVKYVVKYQTSEKDIYDRYVATKYFKNIYERKKWIDQCNGLTIVECLKPEQEILHFLFDNVVLDDEFNKQKLRIHYFDIETEIGDQFMPPSKAENRINMMTIYDNFTDKFYTWSLEHAEIKFSEEPLCSYPKEKFVFFEFNNNEEKMLEHFLDWYENNYADVNVGWNSRAYDWPYVVRRLENLFGKSAAQRLSPIGKYFIKEVNHDNARADIGAEIEASIEGLFIADGLQLYKNKFGIGGNLDGGFSLDNVGEHEGCGHKIKYNGTLKDLYLKDYQKFYEYNVRDVDLVKRIEDKCKMIPLARIITSFGLSQYSTIYSSISYLIGSVIAFAKTQMNNRVFTSYLGEKTQLNGFEGAFVFPTEVGVFSNGIAAIDFASLYPSNIRSINASPETYVGKVLIHYKGPDGHPKPVNERDEQPFNIFDDTVAKADNILGYSIKYPDGKRKSVDIDKLREWIKRKGIYTANNTIFLKHEEKWGTIAKWCEYFYNQRKATKKKMFKIIHELNNNKNTFTHEQKQNMEDEASNLNAKQGAFKNMINSIYGSMGTGFSPIANADIAQSITRQGRLCNISASKFILKRFQELYDPNYKGYNISTLDKDHHDYANVPKIDVIAVGGDTDSQFVDMTCVTEYMRKKYNLSGPIHSWPLDKQQEIWNLMSDFTNNEVNQFVRDLVHTYCHTNEQNVLTYELEYMGSIGIYEGKKHYAVRKIFEEGDKVDKVKYTGIELKKNVLDKAMKGFLAEIYHGILYDGWKESNYQEYISNLYDRFTSFNIDQLAFWKGYNTERDTVGFLQMAVGTTGIAKSCNYYNQIIKKMELGKKYDEIRVGDKVRQVYLKSSNMYGIDTIAYKPGQWPSEFSTIFQIDYKKMFDKIILDPLKRFREACKFQDLDPSKSVIQDIFSL